MAEFNSDNLPTQEENRLTKVLEDITEYKSGRQEQLHRHHAEIAQLKKERLDAVSWQEKNSLTVKIRDKEAYNPTKYLPEFTQAHSPYFASFTIVDDDPEIGKQEFLLGKQSLFNQSQVVIVDWRQAAISSLYYEYEVGEEYEEEINKRERCGLLSGKMRYTIAAGELRRLELVPGTVFEKKQGQWLRAGEESSSAKRKEEAADHHLVDIVSLISPDQFRLITKEYHGCLKLQGSAGAGKTTIALHRLSYLLFNYPEKFRPDRCLVLMFNRALRNYVADSVQDMIGPQTAVETFHSWVSHSLRALGLTRITFSNADPVEFDQIKKASGLANLIEEYAAVSGEAKAIAHLHQLYSATDLLEKHLSNIIPPALLKRFAAYYQKKCAQTEHNSSAIGFADAGVLLRLLQLRLTSKDPAITNIALNHFDHLVIDEAQDFSQVELECLLHATTKERSLTICADPNQQILSSVDSSGLENFHLHLKKSGVTPEELAISYRSTMEIMTVANTVLGKPPGSGSRHGEPVLFRRYQGVDQALKGLEEIVLQEQEKSPNGLVAIICKQKNQVNQLYTKLRSVPGVRKEPQKFQPGILIINCHQVKGLEFTSVILWEASTTFYHEKNINDRNLLYVGLSRACDRLAVLCAGNPTRYLANFFYVNQ